MEPQTDNQETSVEKDTIAENEIESESSEEIVSNNHDNAQAKRGRMITAALVATIVITFIAVMVAGVFELTGRFLRECPRELRVNDPSPILWNDIVSANSTKAGLGVPEKLKQETALKSSIIGQN